jgi:hypothetical protein
MLQYKKLVRVSLWAPMNEQSSLYEGRWTVSLANIEQCYQLVVLASNNTFHERITRMQSATNVHGSKHSRPTFLIS